MGAAPEWFMWNGMRLGEHSERESKGVGESIRVAGLDIVVVVDWTRWKMEKVPRKCHST